MSTSQTDVREIARAAMKSALDKGAKEAAATVSRSRNVSLEWRDGKVEKINEATTRGLSLQLYVDGRYSQVSSSDLRPEALDTFIADSITMTRVLAEDPFRALPEPALYEGRASVDLQLDDPAYPTVTPEQRRKAAQQMEEAARAVKGAEAILSVSTGFDDTRTESFRVASNGFEGTRIDTVFFVSASGQRQGRGRPAARGLLVRRLALPRRGAGDGRRRAGGGGAGDLPPRRQEAALGGRDPGHRQPRGGAADGSARGAALGRVAPAEALLPRGQAGPGDRQPAPRRRGRPAHPEGVRLAPLRRARASPRRSGRSSRRASCAATTSTPTTGRS